jgi:ribonuclease P protein component
MASRYGPRRRLRKGAAFDAVFRRGTRHAGRLFLLVAAPNSLGVHRLGLAVSRRVGGAVARNRARRLLKESFRRLPPAAVGLDLVLVAQRELVSSGQVEVERELRERLRRIRPATGPRGAAAAPGR